MADNDEGKKRPWIMRRRIGMAPLWAGAAAALLAWASFQISPNQTFMAVALVGGAAAWLADRRWARELGVKRFAWVIIGAASGFVLAVRFGWFAWWSYPVLLAVCIGALGTLWWTDPSNRRLVERERDQERWPILAKRLNMPQVHRTPETRTETGRKWRFFWDGGTFTTEAFKGRQRELESALGIPVGHSRIEFVEDEPGQKAPNTIWLVENTQSKNRAAPIDFDAPTMKSFCDPMFIGPFEDGAEHRVTWFDREFGGMHTLAGGATGSGKSGLYHLVMAESALCPDLVRWGIDAKGGMALRPWASIFDWMIDDADDAIHMLLAVHAILKERSKYAAEQGWSVWQPDAEHPVLLILVDEAAEVFGIDAFDMNSLVNSIARMGRAAGVLLLIATQHPSNEALGSTQLTKNVRRRFCFSVEDMAGQTMIIPKSSGKIDATEIPIGPKFAGTYFCSDGGSLVEKTARVRYVTENDVFRLCVRIGADERLAVSDLDKLSADAAVKATIDQDSGESMYEARRIWTADDIRVPRNWTGPLPEGFTGQHGDTPARELVPAGAPRGVDPAVQGDDAFDAEVLGGERTPVQHDGGVPDTPEQLGAPELVMSRRVPGQGAPRVGQSGPPWDNRPDQAFSPEDEGDRQMDLDMIAEPRSAAEQADLDRAVAEYVAQFSEGNVSPAEAGRMLDEMLVAAPESGIAIEDMRKILGRGTTWYGEELRKRIADGRARKLAHGRYAAGPSMPLRSGV